MKHIRTFLGSLRWVVLVVIVASLLTPLIVQAATQTVNRPVTVTATVLGPAPTTPAIITSPSGNITVGVTPLVVSGTCGPGLEVRLTNNGVVVGITTCALDGTFVINISLAEGINNLAALNYDTLNQAGPASPTVVITVRLLQAASSPNSPTNQGTPSSNNPVSGQPDIAKVPNKPSVLYHGDNPIIQSFTRPDSIATIVTLGLLVLIGFIFFRKRKNKT